MGILSAIQIAWHVKRNAVAIDNNLRCIIIRRRFCVAEQLSEKTIVILVAFFKRQKNVHANASQHTTIQKYRGKHSKIASPISFITFKIIVLPKSFAQNCILFSAANFLLFQAKSEWNEIWREAETAVFLLYFDIYRDLAVVAIFDS